MIPKSGYRFSEKIMLRQESKARWRFEEGSSRFKARLIDLDRLSFRLAIGTLAAFVAQRIRIPDVAIFLLAGIAIGPHGLNLIHAGDTLVPELGHLGLLYLMFVAGLELDLKVLQDHRRSAVKGGSLNPNSVIRYSGFRLAQLQTQRT